MSQDVVGSDPVVILRNHSVERAKSNASNENRRYRAAYKIAVPDDCPHELTTERLLSLGFVRLPGHCRAVLCLPLGHETHLRRKDRSSMRPAPHRR